MYRRVHTRWLKHVDFIVLDMVCLVLSLMVAFALRGFGVTALFTDAGYRMQLVSLVIVDFFVIVAFSTLKNVVKRGKLQEFFKTLINTFALASVESLLFYTTKTGAAYSRVGFFYFLVIYTLVALVARILYKNYLIRYAIPKKGTSLLIVCSGSEIPRVNEIVGSGSLKTYRLAGLVLMDAELPLGAAPSLPVVAKGDDGRDWIRQNWVDEVLVLMPASEKRNEIINSLMPMGVTVHVGIENIAGLEAAERCVQTIGTSDVITLCWHSASTLELALKRVIDIVGGLVGCVFTLLITVVIGPIIYIASPGPIFFTQKRVGRNGRIFRIYKFRSMYTDAEERKKEFLAQNRVSDGLMFKLDFDPRIIGNKELPDGTRKTGIGEFIRKTSLDEFPQFFNVLLGDMSLVGTRPPTLDEWEKYKDHHRARLTMRPGITGLWQVSGRSNITDFEEIVKLDTRYIANFSLYEDLHILLKTVLVVLKHEGSM